MGKTPGAGRTINFKYMGISYQHLIASEINQKVTTNSDYELKVNQVRLSGHLPSVAGAG